MHPLDGATDRVNRAGEHLANLKRLADVLQRAYHDALLVRFEPEAPFGLDLVVPIPFSTREGIGICPMPEGIGILVGEISYNLRAALDYLVYELARLDSGEIQENTQFPIEKCEKSFNRTANFRLKGLNVFHIALIEVHQPYRGCDWSGTLKAISNPDKHRTLTAVGYAGVATIGRVGETFGMLPQISTIRRARRPDGIEMDVQLVSSMPIQIWIKSGNVSVVETLELLQCNVAATLDEFKREF